MIEEIKNKIETGDISFSEAFSLIYLEIKNLEKFKEEIYSDATEEVREFNKDEKYYGFKWEVRRGKVTYDFEKDEEYKDLNDKVKSRRKDLTQACKMAENNKVFFDGGSGEQIEAVPIKSVSKDVITFK